MPFSAEDGQNNNAISEEKWRTCRRTLATPRPTKQVLSVRHPHKGTLELGFTIVVPPGRLGQFTKVVQFWPRLLVVNRLGRPLVLEQNSTLR